MCIRERDDTGRVLLPDDLDRVLPLPQHGLDVPGQPLTMGQYVLVRTDSNPVLVLSVQGQGQAAVDCATLAGALISAISRNMVPHADREDALRSICLLYTSSSSMVPIVPIHL